jgi:hypothetical protein
MQKYELRYRNLVQRFQSGSGRMVQNAIPAQEKRRSCSVTFMGNGAETGNTNGAASINFARAATIGELDETEDGDPEFMAEVGQFPQQQIQTG